MDVKTEDAIIETIGGSMPAVVCTPAVPGPMPGVVLLTEAIGVTGFFSEHLKARGR